ncbi:glycosyltransferase family 4 protein [Bacillus sp. Marseille-P3661]|uniref:glycosyltransferase family 4 protein n=1 Tax=Bacillus sp. Marseille-P3661 TaxID=1936234 RepID=UPI0021550559|nr:glycosyltransferase family 4 protein [Bacillus sp. Marseille-P3661]
MKKILFAATVYTHLANFHKPFMKLLQQQGYKIHAIANPDHGRKEEIEELGVICLDIPFPRSPFNIVQILKSISMMKQYFSQHYFDLIHVHTPIAAFLVRLMGKRYKQPIILYTAHGFHFYKGGKLITNLIYYTMEKIAVRWTNGLIVINEEDLTAAKKMGLKEGQTVFLTHGVGVDTEIFTSKTAMQLRQELSIPDTDVIITCVAELNKNKNHLFLLNNWRAILAKQPHTHFILVGNGSDEEFLKNFVHENRLNNIHFLGFRSDVSNILQSSDIVTLLSLREGLPKSMMEAMATGKPAVVTNVRGSRDLIEHGMNGFVVEIGDNEQLVKCLLQLIEHPELREKMGQHAREKVKRYSLDDVIQEVDSIYRKFLD